MSNQLVITSGAKVRSLEGVITGSTGVLNSLPINGSNGIPQLDSNGKILVSQLPNSVMEYKGTWDAATNTPTLANGTGNQGDVYLCNVAGTVNFGAGPITFYVGDQVIYSGTIWQRASGASGTVTSVAVTESGDALSITGSPITTSGTINIGFAGTSAQYVAGDGSLITFPSLTGYVPYTGATANLDLGTFDLTTDIVNLNQLKAIGSGGLNIYSNSGTHIALMGGGGGAGTTLYGGLIGTTASFASSGGSDTFAINHSSGAGIALNITKGGNGEGLYINKTSGSGNAATIIGTLNATTLVKSGGTSSQFLKADGSVDSNTYLTTSAAASTYVPYTGATADVDLGTYNLKANSFNIPSAGSTNQLTSFANTSNLFSGSAGLNVFGFNVSNNIYFGKGATNGGVILWTNSQVRYYTLPDADGTVALTSNLSSYLPLSGGTLTGALNGTSATFTGALTTNGLFTIDQTNGGTILLKTSGSSYGLFANTYNIIGSGSTSDLNAFVYGVNSFGVWTNSTKRLTIDGAGAATFSSSVTTNSHIYCDNGAINFGGTSTFTSTDPAIYRVAGNDLVFANSSAERMRITSGGNVGIGTSSPNSTLHLYKSSGTIFSTLQTGTAYAYVYNDGTNIGLASDQGSTGFKLIVSRSAPDNAMSITSGGNVLINTTTDSGHKLRAVGNSFYLGNDNGSQATPSFLDLGQNFSNGSTRDKLKIYLFNDGANERYGFTVAGEGDIQYHSNAFHKFFINNAEKLRITSGGDVCINTTTSGGYKLNVNGSSSFGSVYVGSLGTGLVYSSSGTLTSTNPSDERLKDNINDINWGLSDILKLRPVSYHWKNDKINQGIQFGFIAQEVQEVMPEAIKEFGEDVKYLGLEKDAIYAALVNAIKELEARLKTIENK
jgi:hypothetical protein